MTLLFSLDRVDTLQKYHEFSSRLIKTKPKPDTQHRSPYGLLPVASIGATSQGGNSEEISMPTTAPPMMSLPNLPLQWNALPRYIAKGGTIVLSHDSDSDRESPDITDRLGEWATSGKTIEGYAVCHTERSSMQMHCRQAPNLSRPNRSCANSSPHRNRITARRSCWSIA